jgi:hypothetical protein
MCRGGGFWDREDGPRWHQGPAQGQDPEGIESQARQPAMSPVHATAATPMAKPVSATTPAHSIVAAISRAVRATRARRGPGSRAPRMPMARSHAVAASTAPTATTLTPGSRPVTVSTPAVVAVANAVAPAMCRTWSGRCWRLRKRNTTLVMTASSAFCGMPA